MRNIQRVGPYVHIVEARAPDNSALVIELGVIADSFQHYLHNNLATVVSQFYGLIQPGLAAAVHAFRGLNRPLYMGGDASADSSVIVYSSLRPEFDYVWTGGRDQGMPVQKVPPAGRVFVVLVREFPTDEYGVQGSVEHWNWVARGSTLAPSSDLLGGALQQ